MAALAVAAGCSSSPTPAPPSSGSQATTSPATRPDGSTPSSPDHSSQAPAPSAAQRAAQAVQGSAAVPTAAQLAALRQEQPEIARLSPAQLAGQRVIYSYNGLSAPASLLDAIRHGLVGGVIFFNFNISSQAQIGKVIAQMIAANASPDNPARHYPLLLMTDQEGGLVRRLPGRPGSVGGADRRVRRPVGRGRGGGLERRREPAQRRHERQSRTGPGRVPAGR